MLRLVLALIGGLAMTVSAAAHDLPRNTTELFGPAETQRLLMRMEVALARVQARRGIIPAAAAEEIAHTATLEAVPLAAVAAIRAARAAEGLPPG